MARKGLLPTPQSYSQGESKSMPGLTPLDIAVRPELAKHAERAKERRKGLLPTPPQRDWKSGAASDETLNRNARDKAGVVGVHWHDSRHTAITRLAQRLHVLDLARMVGHRDLRQLQTYYNPPAEELAEKLG